MGTGSLGHLLFFLLYIHKMNKQAQINLWKIASIILIILLAGYFGFNYTKNKYLNQGYQAGQFNIINSIQQTGNIPYFENDTIKTISISQICSGGK